MITPSRFRFSLPSITCVVAGLGLVAPTAVRGQDRPYADRTVALEKVDVVTDKQSHFSLPLDATPGTASRLGLANRDVPASVSIVTQEVIQLRGFRTAVEAVEGAVGMTGGTQFGSIPGYSTRGFSSNNITVLRDGIRQNTASQAARINDSFILDRVEILKGPASLMFGEGAVGGAVNYVSKSPDRTFRSESLVSLGAWNTFRFGAGVGGPIIDGKLLGRFDFSRSSTDGYIDRNEQEYTAYAGSVQLLATDRLSITASSTYLRDRTKSYYGTPIIYDAVVNTTVPNAAPEVRKVNTATDRLINPRVDSRARRTNYNIADNDIQTENSYHRVRAEFDLTPQVAIRNEAYLATQWVKWRNLENNTWNPVTQRVDLSEFLLIYRDDLLVGNRLDATFESNVAGRDNRLVIGLDVSRNDLTRGGTPGNVATTLPSVTLIDPVVMAGPAAHFTKTARVAIETAAFFAEDVFEVTPTLKIVGGLRYDDIHIQRDTLANPTTAPATPFSTFFKNYHPWTGRAGAVWAVTRSVNLYASYSRAAEPVTQLVSLSSARADFSLQKGRQYEAGVKGTFVEGKVDATLALFDILKKDLLTQTIVDGVRVSQQIGAIQSRGIEAALAVIPGEGWRVEANVAYTDAAYRDFNENLGTGIISREGNVPPAVPEVVTNLFISKRFANGFLLSGGPRHVGKRAANNNNSLWSDAYTTLDAAAGYAWGNCAFTLRGRNLLDEEYEEMPTAGGAMRRLADPRSTEISVRYTF